MVELFAGTELDPRIVPDASALKMTYAAWTKGTTALLVAAGQPAGFGAAAADVFRGLSSP